MFFSCSVAGEGRVSLDESEESVQIFFQNVEVVNMPNSKNPTMFQRWAMWGTGYQSNFYNKNKAFDMHFMKNYASFSILHQNKLIF